MLEELQRTTPTFFTEMLGAQAFPSVLGTGQCLCIALVQSGKGPLVSV